MSHSYPYIATATIKYKSPHATDLSFAKGETVRVTGPSEDDEDWVIGESLDGQRTGGFPKDFVERIEESEEPASVHENTIPDPVLDTSAAPEPSIESQAVPGSFPDESQIVNVPPAKAAEAESEPTPTKEIPAPKSSAAVPSDIVPVMKASPGVTETAEPSKLSFKDRLAAFNSPKSTAGSPGRGPPPALKPKPAAGGPGTWSYRQKQKEEEEKKLREAGVAPVPQVASVIESSDGQEPTSEVNEKASGQMSASDAKASIGQGLSLKERMAALAGSQAFGGTAASTQPEAPPKPSKTWKRPEVAAGEEATLPIPGQMAPVRSNSMRSTEGPEAETEGEQNAGDSIAEERGLTSEGGEQDDEQQEKERRAAIAARMARLGGRGMFGAAPPALKPKPGSGSSKDATNVPVAPVENVAQPVTDAPAPQMTEEPSIVDVPTGPPAGVAMPAMPRRAAGPRRKAAPTASTITRNDSTASSDAIPELSTQATAEPSEQPQLAKDTPDAIGLIAEQARAEARHPERALEEDAGRLQGAAEGAQNAGIALAPVPSSVPGSEERPAEGSSVNGQEPARTEEGPSLVGAQGSATSVDRGTASDFITSDIGANVQRLPPPPLPAGAGFGSDDEEEEEDDDVDILQQAKSGQIHLQPSTIDAEIDQTEEEGLTSPRSPVGFAPIKAPAPASPSDSRLGRITSPSGSHLSGLGLPRDEVELKHDNDAALDEEDETEAADEEEIEDEDEMPPPPPPRVDRPVDKPAGPRPMPNPPVLGQTPAPPVLSPSEVDIEDAGEEEDESAPAPPPRPQPVVRPAQPVSAPQQSSTVEPPVSPSPTVDEEAARRQGIAARMAKLGGIKLGGPPLIVRTPSNIASEDPASPVELGQRSPILEHPPSPLQATLQSSGLEAGNEVEEDESEDAAAARRRATLARLQAGGRLGGFNMFNRTTAPESPGIMTEVEESGPVLDERNIEPEAQPDVFGSGAVYDAPQLGQVDITRDTDDVDEEEADAPPPPPRRQSTRMKSPPQSPIRETPLYTNLDTSSEVAGMSQGVTSSGLAPPLPLVVDNLTNEPETLIVQAEEDQEDRVGPPPPPRPVEVTPQPAHRRSDSIVSRLSMSSRRSTGAIPASPTNDRRTSMQSTRPGYNDLQQAAATVGIKVYRAAQKLADIGKRQSVGDGTSRAFVWSAMADAGLDANVTFGSLIWEQEGATQNKRYDEIRTGDIVILHDAKFKGKKGLVSYAQQVGSVEEPMFSICAESEQKKTKVKVWQVERGHIGTESYRLDDLQSGLVRVFRPT